MNLSSYNWRLSVSISSSICLIFKILAICCSCISNVSYCCRCILCWIIWSPFLISSRSDENPSHATWPVAHPFILLSDMCPVHGQRWPQDPVVELPNSELLQDSIKGMTPTLPNHFHRIVQHSRPQTITQILTMTTIVSTLSPFNIPPQPLSSSPRLSRSFSQNHLASPPFHPRNN